MAKKFLYLRHWARNVKLDPKPALPPGVIRRFSDNVRVRTMMGDKFPTHIYHLIICIGALVAHREDNRWAVTRAGRFPCSVWAHWESQMWRRSAFYADHAR